ncbi:hypothetical protein [Flagellimonas myxillae]|nr:hypothetical protein [Muricauda myxillae]
MILEIAIPFTLFLSLAFVVASLVFSLRKKRPVPKAKNASSD